MDLATKTYADPSNPEAAEVAPWDGIEMLLGGRLLSETRMAALAAATISARGTYFAGEGQPRSATVFAREVNLDADAHDDLAQ